MKKLYLLLIFGMMIFGNGKGQNLIAVQNGGVPKFFTNLPDAINNAQNGDTVYIPGGSWNIDNLIIGKTLHIIGTGYNPDLAQASGVCNLLGTLTLQEGCSNGSLAGVYLQGYLVTKSNTETISSYNISRCRMPGIFLSSNSSFWLVRENVIEAAIDGITRIAHDNIFSNNIIGGIFANMGMNNNIKNNIFLRIRWALGDASASVNNSTFSNNVFLGSSSLCDQCYNLFYNNLFRENIIFPTSYSQGSNNIVSQEQSTIFVSQTGYNFSFTDDYHIQVSSPGHNGGTDGTDVGIYGGAFPWKDGSLPANPHVFFKQVAGSTDTNGNLNVKMKVAAQDH